MKRAILVLSGRGSYLRDSLGMLQGIESTSLSRLNDYRQAMGRSDPLELDGAERFSTRKHVAGSEASLLTAACTLSDIDQINPQTIEIVGACGNSMGWYTTLAAAGVLSIEDAATLIDTLGGYQAEALIGERWCIPSPMTIGGATPPPYKLLKHALAVTANFFGPSDSAVRRSWGGRRQA